MVNSLPKMSNSSTSEIGKVEVELSFGGYGGEWHGVCEIFVYLIWKLEMSICNGWFVLDTRAIYSFHFPFLLYSKFS